MTVAEEPRGFRAEGHRLAPLLAPRSIACVGASPRAKTPGNDMLLMIRKGGFTGEVFPINPRYEEIEGRRCYGSIGDLPQPVDLVLLSVANARLEAALQEAIAAKARAAVIFGSCYLEGDSDPPLTARIAAMARATCMPICGGNGMGFYADAAGVWAAAFDTERERRVGGIAFISHAGSSFGSLTHNDKRFRFSLAVSAGQELATTVADYMDYALELPETRVIGLFLEAVRDPPGFVAALEKAARRQVPVVVLKVGRTEASAKLAISHSGAIAGNDAAFRALFERYGVIQVDTVDELGAALLLFEQPRRPAAGGLAAIGDSGGEREMIVDLAAQVGVPFAAIGPETVTRMRARLDYGLEPVNPLDAWGTGHDFINIFADSFSAMLEDPDTAMGLFFNNLRDGYYVHEGFRDAALIAAERTQKPVAYATNYTQVRHAGMSVDLTHRGVPVMDGTIAALKAVRGMLDYRDFQARPADPPPTVRRQRDWRARLAEGTILDEAEGLALLADYGIPTLPAEIAESLDAAVAAARRIGFPAVLKTAMPGILHKTERDGVRLGLADEAALGAAYRDLADRLGPRVLVTRMARPAAELALGATIDPQFGPLVMVGAGGILVEVLRDVAHGLAPFGPSTARRLLDRLRVRPLLDGVRGRPGADLAALADAIANFSAMVAELADLLAEIDVNPLGIGPEGAIALDVLVVPRRDAAKA